MSRSEAYQLRTLGAVALERDGRSVELGGRVTYALLAYLAWNAGKLHSRGQLAALFWQHVPKTAARHSLSQVLYRVRATLPGVVRLVGKDWIGLNEGTLTVDVREFIQLAEEGSWRKAFDLYHGEFFTGTSLDTAQELRYWIDRLRARSIHAYDWVAAMLAKEEEANGNWQAVVRVARQFLAHRPFERGMLETLFRALSVIGGQDAVLSELRSQVQLAGEESDFELVAWFNGIIKSCAETPMLEENATHHASEPYRFVGRGADFGQLRRLWTMTVEGKAQAVLLTGEPGIGKSRLADQLARLAVLQGGRVLAGRCYEAERRVPYSGIADAFRWGLRPADFGEVDGKWLSTLADFLPEVCPTAEPSEWELPRDVEWRRRRLFESVAQMLETVASRAPVLIVLDDSQWADESTLAVVSYCRRRLFDSRVCLLLVARSGEAEDNAALRNLIATQDLPAFNVLELGELTPLAVDELVEAVEDRAGRRLAANVRQAILSAVGGRPFILLECLHQALLHNQENAQVPRVSSRSAELNLGAGVRVERFVQARLALLNPEARIVAFAAAVADAHATARVVSKVCGLAPDQILNAVYELTRRRLFKEAGPVLSFTHELLRQAVYLAIPVNVRQVLHGAVADTLSTDASTAAGVLATHYYTAGLQSKAFNYLVAAARASARTLAHSESAYYWELAVRAAAAKDEQYTALDGYGTFLLETCRVKESMQVLAGLESEYEARGDGNGLLTLRYARLATDLADGSAPVGLLLSRFQELANSARTADPRRFAQILGSLAEVAHDAGHQQMVEALMHSLVQAADGLGATRDAAECLRIAARLKCLYDRPAAGTVLAGRALEIARKVGDGFVMIESLLARAAALVRAGNLGEAKADLAAAVELADRPGLEQYRVKANADYGVALLESGEFAAARGALSEALAFATNHDKLCIYANLAALGLETRDFELTRSAADALEELNANIRAKWVTVMVPVFMGLVDLEAGCEAEARRRGLEVQDTIADGSVVMGDSSYLFVFLARLTANEGKVEAVGVLERGLEADCMDVFSALRIRLELAAMKIDHDSDQAWRLARDVKGEALRMGASGIVLKAERILERIS
jgi:DNA-binding SARP family transcriptional activator/tetratricopeptide (TPR) repeat protein